MPSNTYAFYFYAEPNSFSTYTLSATTNDGGSSGSISVTGNGGAKYFGFYATGSSTLSTITINVPSAANGFAVGEFGISQCPLPALTLPDNITIECNESTDPSHTGSATAVDASDVSLTTTYSDVTTQGSCPNNYTITRTWSATNSCGTTASADQTITVQDTHAPTISLTGSSIEFWPPNHAYHTVNVSDFVTGVSDACTTGLSVSNVVITRVTSDEPDDAVGGGDGNTTNDIVIANNCHSVQLREERNGSGNGRVYRIYVAITDGCGNTGTASFPVSVRANQGGSAAIEGSAANTVDGSCTVPKLVLPPADQPQQGSEFNLMENYPNPFNASTVIPYSISVNGHVRLSVVDANGRTVAVPVDEVQNAGQYSLLFKNSELPNGTYFYVLESNGERLVGSMILSK
jgi:hypothetical protein